VGHVVFAAFHNRDPFFCVIELSVYGLKCRALVDTGATISILSGSFAGRLHNLRFQAPSTTARSMTSHSLPLTTSTRLGLRLGTYAVHHRFQVMPGSPHDLIIGTDLLRHLKCVSFDFVNCHMVLPDNSRIRMIPWLGKAEHLCVPVHLIESATLPPRSENILPCRVPFDVGTNILIDSTPVRMVQKGVFLGKVLCDVREKNTAIVRALNPNPFPVRLYRNLTVAQAEVLSANEDIVCVAENERSPCNLMRGPSPAENPLDALSFDHSILSAEQKARLLKLLTQFKHTFSAGPLDLGRTGLVKHVIPTGDAQPIKQKPRRIPETQRRLVDDMVSKMLQQGVISKSCSPWSSPVVLVTKKDKSWRFCVDYRRVNDVTKVDGYPLPRIIDILDSLGKSKIFSTLDFGLWLLAD
ncbi:MAG: hypothetical protein GY696_35780, partial [Gammaproteobacteria bacterium]|nr:hypothetical protein [Gammaproteobacteria bacterium]